MKKVILLMIAMIVFASCSNDDDPQFYCVHLTNTSFKYIGAYEKYTLNFRFDKLVSYVKKLDGGTEWQTYSYEVCGNNIRFFPGVNGLDSLSGQLISEDKINLINHTTKKTVILSMQ